MLNITLITFLFILWVDAYVLKRYNPLGFAAVFQFPRWLSLLILSLLVAVCGVAAETADFVILCFILIFLMPMYFLRRKNYKIFLPPRMESEPLSRIEMLYDCLGNVLIWFNCSIVLTLIFKFIAEVFPSDDSGLREVIWITLLSSIIQVVLIYHAVQKFSGRGFWNNVGFDLKGKSAWRVFVLPTIIGFSIACFSAYIIVVRKIQPPTPIGDLVEQNQSVILLFLFLGLALLLAPLIEEITFRGYLFHVLKRVKGTRFAVYIVAGLFALLHVGQYWGDWAAISIVAILGLVLSWVRAWTGTAMASTVMHYVYNMGVTVLPVLFIFLSNPAFMTYQLQYQILSAEQKEELLKESIQKQPDLSQAYNDLAWLYAEENRNLDEALRLIEKALEISPDEYAYKDTKAEVLFKLGQYEKSLSIREDLLHSGLLKSMEEYQLERIQDTRKFLP